MKLNATKSGYQLFKITHEKEESFSEKFFKEQHELDASVLRELCKECSWKDLKQLTKEERSILNWDPEPEPELEPDYDFDPYRNPPLEEVHWDWWRYDYSNRIIGIID